MTELIQPVEVLAAVRRNLGLAAKSETLDLELASELVRRTAGITCPCSPASIVERVVQCLYGVVDTDVIRRLAQESLDELVGAGDLLELERVTSVDERARGSWLFLAPPTFIQLPSGAIRLLGMAAEETLPLPASLMGAVERAGTKRTIPRGDAEVSSLLAAAGFRQLSLDTWLREPRACSAKEHVKAIAARLAAAPRAGEIAELRILSRVADNYASRWTRVTRESGRYLARRPQEFGPDLWCYAELDDGMLVRFVDLPLSGSAWRGCDEGWRLQLALDAEAGAPNRFSFRRDADGVVVELFFPIPMWAERRLESEGSRVRPKSGLFAYAIPEQAGTAMSRYLETTLWMREAH